MLLLSLPKRDQEHHFLRRSTKPDISLQQNLPLHFQRPSLFRDLPPAHQKLLSEAIPLLFKQGLKLHQLQHSKPHLLPMEEGEIAPIDTLLSIQLEAPRKLIHVPYEVEAEMLSQEIEVRKPISLKKKSHIVESNKRARQSRRSEIGTSNRTYKREEARRPLVLDIARPVFTGTLPRVFASANKNTLGFTKDYGTKINTNILPKQHEALLNRIAKSRPKSPASLCWHASHEDLLIKVFDKLGQTGWKRDCLVGKISSARSAILTEAVRLQTLY